MTIAIVDDIKEERILAADTVRKDFSSESYGISLL